MPVLWMCHNCHEGPQTVATHPKCCSCSHEMCTLCPKDRDIPSTLGLFSDPYGSALEMDFSHFSLSLLPIPSAINGKEAMLEEWHASEPEIGSGDIHQSLLSPAERPVEPEPAPMPGSPSGFHPTPTTQCSSVWIKDAGAIGFDSRPQ